MSEKNSKCVTQIKLAHIWLICLFLGGYYHT